MFFTRAKIKPNSQPANILLIGLLILHFRAKRRPPYLCSMNWIELKDESQLDIIKEESASQPVVIFKHSSRCSISDMAKMRLERSQNPEGVKFYFLDLLRYRSVSNKVADMFEVWHESPQVLLIKNGECIYDESHNGISMQDIAEQAA